MKEMAFPNVKLGVMTAVAWVMVGLVPADAQGQPAPDYDFQWAVIGSPGNRPTNSSEVPWNPDWRIGDVGYEYRISKTELTTRQYFEFLQAYTPFMTGYRVDDAFTSRWIFPDFNGGYYTFPENDNLPAEFSWRMAARYCNWLHNGKVSEAWAFENGAYDTSTFGYDPQGYPTDQLAHSSGARFWIPTVNEWVKAVYFDQARYGAGLEGYWLHPGGRDTPLVAGLPEAGGETNAGIVEIPSDVLAMDIMSYPHITSPWGLWDVSGGAREWIEGFTGSALHRRAMGSPIHGIAPQEDRLDWGGALGHPERGVYGFRLASSIPAPSTAFAIVIVGLLSIQQRRRYA